MPALLATPAATLSTQSIIPLLDADDNVICGKKLRLTHVKSISLPGGGRSLTGLCAVSLTTLLQSPNRGHTKTGSHTSNAKAERKGKHVDAKMPKAGQLTDMKLHKVALASDKNCRPKSEVQGVKKKPNNNASTSTRRFSGTKPRSKSFSLPSSQFPKLAKASRCCSRSSPFLHNPENEHHTDLTTPRSVSTDGKLQRQSAPTPTLDLASSNRLDTGLGSAKNQKLLRKRLQDHAMILREAAIMDKVHQAQSREKEQREIAHHNRMVRRAEIVYLNRILKYIEDKSLVDTVSESTSGRDDRV